MSGETQPTSGSRQRIDKWLFFARMVKSRSLAQSHIQSGHVRINGERCNHPSQVVKPGDRIELTLERRDFVLVVRLAGERRGLTRRRACSTTTNPRRPMRQNVSRPMSRRSGRPAPVVRPKRKDVQSTG